MDNGGVSVNSSTTTSLRRAFLTRMHCFVYMVVPSMSIILVRCDLGVTFLVFRDCLCHSSSCLRTGTTCLFIIMQYINQYLRMSNVRVVRIAQIRKNQFPYTNNRNTSTNVTSCCECITSHIDQAQSTNSLSSSQHSLMPPPRHPAWKIHIVSTPKL